MNDPVMSMYSEKSAVRKLHLIAQVLREQPEPAADDRPLVRVGSGLLRGIHDQGTLSFRGIPYARPPVGELRFRVAEPPEAWAGVREARDFGAACPQLVSTDITENGNTVVSEDCLTLNVWTPALDGLRRPVMVWIHGGALIEGSARNAWYNGATLARRGDVVLVTLQYRLGAFGFLHLAGIGGPAFAQSGNLGLLDQVEALRWIRQNAAAFGGDADNVTVFGESAGGASVAMLLGMPAASGLFHKAIVQSMSPQLGRSPQRSDTVARAFMREAGVDTVQALQSLRTADLLAAQHRLFESATADNAFWPTIDGTVLPAHAMDRLRDGHGMPVPLMIGTTLDEVRFWTEIEDVPLLRKPAGAVARQLQDVAGPQAPAVTAAYGLSSPSTQTVEDGRIQLAGDLVFRMPSIRVAEHLGGQQPVWMYLFSYRSSSPFAPYQSAHAMELPFLFGTLDDPSAVAFTGRCEGREVLARAMQDAWTRFAHHGDPSCDALPGWTRYSVECRATMDLGLASQLVDDPLAEQRRAWGDTPFDRAMPDEFAVGHLLFDPS